MRMIDMIIEFGLITCCQSTGLTSSRPFSQGSPSLFSMGKVISYGYTTPTLLLLVQVL